MAHRAGSPPFAPSLLIQPLTAVSRSPRDWVRVPFSGGILATQSARQCQRSQKLTRLPVHIFDVMR